MSYPKPTDRCRRCGVTKRVARRDSVICGTLDVMGELDAEFPHHVWDHSAPADLEVVVDQVLTGLSRGESTHEILGTLGIQHDSLMKRLRGTSAERAYQRRRHEERAGSRY